jgi:hypothetical protein
LAGREKQFFISDPDATGENLLGELADLVALVGTALLRHFDRLSFPNTRTSIPETLLRARLRIRVGLSADFE